MHPRLPCWRRKRNAVGADSSSKTAFRPGSTRALNDSLPLVLRVSSRCKRIRRTDRVPHVFHAEVGLRKASSCLPLATYAFALSGAHVPRSLRTQHLFLGLRRSLLGARIFDGAYRIGIPILGLTALTGTDGSITWHTTRRRQSCRGSARAATKCGGRVRYSARVAGPSG